MDGDRWWSCRAGCSAGAEVARGSDPTDGMDVPDDAGELYPLGTGSGALYLSPLTDPENDINELPDRLIEV